MSREWGDLTPPYRTIVADPPWRFPSAFTKADAGKHYSTMSLGDICRLPVQQLADDSTHLWLWAVNGLLEEAFVVMRSWGFSLVTVVTWCKNRPGVGHYVRNNTEHVLLCSRGKPQVPEDKPLSSWFEWPVGVHSAKPEGFYGLVETVSPGPYVELFARQPHLGWDSWGRGFEASVAS